MSGLRCEHVRDRLPDLAAGRLDGPAAEAMGAHLSECEDCSAELELVGLLLRGRPEAPAALAGEIRARMGGLGVVDGGGATTPDRRRSQPSRFPWWGLAAAAVASLALGVGVQVRSPTSVPEAGSVPAYLVESAEDELWLSGDGEIAGAPSLEDLSDDALERFLEELDAGGVA